MSGEQGRLRTRIGLVGIRLLLRRAVAIKIVVSSLLVPACFAADLFVLLVGSVFCWQPYYPSR
jgi:hypothetical protein